MFIHLSMHINNSACGVHNCAFESNALGSQSQAWIKEEGWSYACRYIGHLKKDKRSPMNVTSTVVKHQFGKGDRW